MGIDVKLLNSEMRFYGDVDFCQSLCYDAVYQLLAFISHMGTSTQSGHYVVHVKRDGRWVIYNDNKVALSGDPPKDMGYLYFFQRVVS